MKSRAQFTLPNSPLTKSCHLHRSYVKSGICGTVCPFFFSSTFVHFVICLLNRNKRMNTLHKCCKVFMSCRRHSLHRRFSMYRILFQPKDMHHLCCAFSMCLQYFSLRSINLLLCDLRFFRMLALILSLEISFKTDR